MQIQEEWLAVKEPVWVFRNRQFLKAIIKQIYKDVFTCMLENGDTFKAKRAEIFQRNLLPVQYTRSDLMENDVINQPEILQHLALRFQNNKIYTYVESTLIAVNPYKNIAQLYTEELKDMYIRGIVEESGNMKDFQPHLYAITSSMIKSLFQDKKDQAVIISGESGAGKTEVNKQCLRFLQRYFKKITVKQDNDGDQTNNIQRAIMLSNPILQGFGNSKTIRNNNSSRFGKFLKIVLDSNSKKIKHAQIYNYLLEKSRIISRSKQQQNFHVLYQFLINTTPNQKVKYCLVDQKTNQFLTFQDFAFTKNQTQTEYFANPEVTLAKIKQSLTILPDQNSFDYLCRILSAVLHLGNLEVIEDQNNDKCQIVPVQTYDKICMLLQVDKKLLFDSLTIYRAKIGGQQLVKQFSKRQIEELIHSLAKALYQRLFQWIINEINKSTRAHDNQGASLVSLGFLDIYGFQVLKTNSLQQLFINYTNERLHQLYLQKIFKLQKQYFIAQKLEEKFKEIDFEDNLKVIQLIDYQPLSLFNLLDQWCTIASPDQSTLITKFRFNHKKHQKFPPSNMTLLSTIFAIKHTPQDVQYSVIGFREKNKDLFRQQIKKTMIQSKLSILNDMFTDTKDQNDIFQSKSQKVKKFLSQKFRKQMNQLMDGFLNKVQQHFIRCIKSNGNKKPIQVDQQLVYSQIKYLGILDTIKIKKMGYCIKPKYDELDKKFPWVVRKSYMKKATPQQIRQKLKVFLPKFGQQHILYGNTKVFFKDTAYNVLMRKYSEYYQSLKLKALMIASALIKSIYIRKRNQKIRNKKIVLQYAKGFLGHIDYLKMKKRVSIIQKTLRSFLEFRSQAKKFESIQIIQNYIKRNVESILRVKKMNLIKKVIFTFKYQKLKRKVKAKLFAKQFVQKYLINRAWNKIKEMKVATISKYLQSFKVKIIFRSQIHLASRNQLITRQGRSLQNMQNYLLAFSSILVTKKKLQKIMKLQSNIRTYLTRIRYQRIRNRIVQIQRTLRQYLFMKVTVKSNFQKAYHSYEKQLITQNNRLKSRLYDTGETNASQINGSIKKFLGKFKQKISLIYLVIDVQAFIDLQITYPRQSWLENYIQCFNQGLEKNDPIQQLSVGQTFTIAASTSKMYLWGMHETCKNQQPSAISTIKTKMPVQFFEINHNKLKFLYVKQDENYDKKNQRSSKRYSTIARDFSIQNYRLYQCVFQQVVLIKQIPYSEKVLQVSCGSSHTILRSSKKVFTFGIGRQGQLGHSVFNSEQTPRSIKFFEYNKTSYPIQVAASFTSSLVLLSNHKLYWFGKNSTLFQVCTPTLFQLKSKYQIMNSNQFAVGRILPTWSRTMSVIGVTVLCYNKKFQNNISLRNKTTDILLTKWHEAGIYNINPPVIPSVSDHLQQCHIKLRNKKINIYPQSKSTLKQMQQKVKSIASIPQPETVTNRNSVGTQFSFANTQHNSVVR